MAKPNQLQTWFNSFSLQSIDDITHASWTWTLIQSNSISLSTLNHKALKHNSITDPLIVTTSGPPPLKSIYTSGEALYPFLPVCLPARRLARFTLPILSSVSLPRRWNCSLRPRRNVLWSVEEDWAWAAASALCLAMAASPSLTDRRQSLFLLRGNVLVRYNPDWLPLSPAFFVNCGVSSIIECIANNPRGRWL